MLWVVFLLVSVSVFHAGFPEGFILCLHKTCFAVACRTCRELECKWEDFGPVTLCSCSHYYRIFPQWPTCSIRYAGLSSVGPLTPVPLLKICSGSQWSLVPLTRWGFTPSPSASPVPGWFGCFSLFTCYLCHWNVCRPLFCFCSPRPLCTVTAASKELLFSLWWCSSSLLVQRFLLLPRFDLILLLSPCALFQEFTWLPLLLGAGDSQIHSTPLRVCHPAQCLFSSLPFSLWAPHQSVSISHPRSWLELPKLSHLLSFKVLPSDR